MEKREIYPMNCEIWFFLNFHIKNFMTEKSTVQILNFSNYANIWSKKIHFKFFHMLRPKKEKEKSRKTPKISFSDFPLHHHNIFLIWVFLENLWNFMLDKSLKHLLVFVSRNCGIELRWRKGESKRCFKKKSSRFLRKFKTFSH
jgi:hypothetical protein